MSYGLKTLQRNHIIECLVNNGVSREAAIGIATTAARITSPDVVQNIDVIIKGLEEAKKFLPMQN